MKIAFVGTHGTGKTTLAHELVMKLKKKGVDAGFMSEVARNCPFPINQETTRKSQVWITLNQIIRELEAEVHCDTLVSDRSVLDGYCYYVRKFGRAQFLEELIKVHLKTYDYIIRVPVRKGFLIKDKVRSTDERFQKEVDEVFDKMLKEFKVKHIVLKEKQAKSNKHIVESVLDTIIK